MVYWKTIEKECIAVHPMNDMKSVQFVELTKYGDVPMFSVYVDDGKNEWIWEFDMTCPSDYERVKLNIFDVIFECDTMPELVRELNEIFNEGFETILIKNDECEGCFAYDECNKYR